MPSSISKDAFFLRWVVVLAIGGFLLPVMTLIFSNSMVAVLVQMLFVTLMIFVLFFATTRRVIRSRIQSK